MGLGQPYRPAWVAKLNDKLNGTSPHLANWIVRLESERIDPHYLLGQLERDLREANLTIWEMAERKYFVLRSPGTTQRGAVECAVKMIKGCLPMFRWSDLVGGTATPLSNSIETITCTGSDG